MTERDTTAARKPAIEAIDVFRIFSTPEGEAAALQGLTFTADEREIVVVLGPSGSGKTTFLRILAGLDRPSAGTVRVLGSDLTKLSDAQLGRYRADRIGVVDQHYFRSLSPHLAALDLTSLPLDLAGVPRPIARERARELLERVGLGQREDARQRELSGGEQQRIAICAALARRPHVLLADEPTGELDAATAASLYQLIGELAQEQSLTALIVTHDEQAVGIADRVVRIRDGRLSGEALSPGRGADEAVVIGRGGWLRLPEEVLHGAGIADRALVKTERRRVVLEPPSDAPGDRRRVQPRSTDARPRPIRERLRPGEPVAVLEGVRKSYRSGGGENLVFEDLGAAFGAGTLHLVMGRSGSGKTALLDLIGGLERPTAGEVILLGTPLSRLSRAELADLRRRYVAVIGQGPNLVSFLTAFENVELSLRLRGFSAAAARAGAKGWLAEVGLAERLDQRAARLSAGEQQRVAIARVLAVRPALVLADEPTARLDEQNAASIALLLARAAHEGGAAVICATHDRKLADYGDARLELETASRSSGWPNRRGH